MKEKLKKIIITFIDDGFSNLCGLILLTEGNYNVFFD
jgi:hypothetical protein